MRWQWLMAATLALTGCGARTSLGTGEGAAATPEVAHLALSCGPTDGSGFALTVGWPACQPPTNPPPGFQFFIGQGVHVGSAITVVDDPNGVTTGVRLSGATTTPITSGTLDFATFAGGVGASGTYDVTWVGGSASGSFLADWCPSMGPCG